METQPHRTEINGRVRIKDDMTHMYPSARVYNEAIVRGQMHDPLGYPLIKVEWDKDHWAYSGEEDRWVLEAHFDPVEGKSSMDKKPDINEFTEALASLISDHFGGGEDEAGLKPKPKDKEDNRPDREYNFEETLDLGVDDARNSAAFVLFIATHDQIDDKDVLIPAVFRHSKRGDAELLLEVAISDYVALSLARLVNDALKDEHDGSSSA